MKKLPLFSLCIITLSLATAFIISIDLEKKSLLKDKVQLLIPSDFEIMSKKMMKLKYPNENRPTLIYTNETGGINVALNLTTNPANQEVIPAIQKSFEKTFKNLYPSAEWLNMGEKEINGRQVGFLELVSPAIDTEIYNLIFYTDLDGSLLLCTFNCTKKDMDEWKPIAHDIMNSFRLK